MTLAALKFLRVLHAVDNGKYSPHLGCQAENANEDLKISSDYTKAMVYVLKRQ